MIGNGFAAEIDQITLDVLKRVDYKHFLDEITNPLTSRLKLKLLFLYLYSKSYSLDEIRAICTATMLVQMGLDIHEWVTNEKEKNSDNIRTRQLQVLAGNYFSSQYYALLANIGRVDVIQNIAKSIRSINQHKVQLYQLKDRSKEKVNKWLEDKTFIESELIAGFISQHDHTWLDIVRGFLKLELILTSTRTKTYFTDQTIKSNIGIFYQIQSKISDIPLAHVKKELRQLLFQYEGLQNILLVAEEI